ncbi:MAG: VWA domain-containing protein [Planctomycetes bacterium]|nr:VWA domain-containing protein [Planctomycetota bacterium]
MTLQNTRIRAEIVDGVATTVIEQTFHNHGGRDAEGTWFLPLPNGAVADGFTMNVGGKELAGEVLDAGQARSVYESIVRRKRDPGLLEYAGEGMLRARVYPIPARGDVIVTVRLRQILQPLGNMFEWQWPLRSMQYGDTGCGPLSMDVKISSQTRISTVVSPHDCADIDRKGDHEARVTFEGKGDQLEDLRVLYGLSEQEFGLHLLTWRQLADPGYFVMLLSPPRELEKNIPRRCVQFVVDTSGSMKGAKIEQAKSALGMFLKSLRPGDLFQVVTFASSVQTFFDRPRLASEENIAAALTRIDRLEAKGGTNIAEALQQALEVEVPADDDGGSWLGQIVFVTDGEPTVGVTVPSQILELTRSKDRQQMRLFALGVGDEIDVRLIDDLVQQHRGARDFVRNKEKIEVKVDALCQKIAWPALTDVEVRCDELDAFDVHPTRTRDLFCGEMLQVVGRYRSSGMQVVRVRGKQNGIAREFVFEVEFPKLDDKHTFVQTIWARQHVATLLDAIRRNGARSELIDEVRRLATRYGIVTPYTSQLIVEETERLASARPDDRRAESGGRRAGDKAGAPTPQERDRFGMSSKTPGPTGPSTLGPPVPSAPGPATRGGQGAPARGAAPGSSAAPASPRPDATRRLAEMGKDRTGAEAVAESVLTASDDFFLGGGSKADAEARARVRLAKREAEMLRRAAGRVFVKADDDLVEQGLPTDWQAKAVIIEAFSDAYFELLRSKPQLRAILALGERVVFKDGDRIVHVKPAATKEVQGTEPKKTEPKKAGQPAVVK